MEDIRIGRKGLSSAQSVSVGAVSATVISGAKDRIALIIGPPASGTLSLTILPTATANNGLVLAAGAAPIMLDLQKYGELVTRSWQGIHSVGGVAFEFFETFLPHQ